MVKILIIENSAFMKNLLKFIFENEGHSVVGTAVDGKEALELLNQHKPDIITCCDTFIGGTDALPVIKAILEIDQKAKIMLAYNTDRPQKIEPAKKLGVVGLIEKPYTHIQVTDELKRIIKEYRLSQY